MKLVVVCPHFAPDTAPTGDVMTRIVTELAALGHTIDVVAALPWYREHRIDPLPQLPAHQVPLRIRRHPLILKRVHAVPGTLGGFGHRRS